MTVKIIKGQACTQTQTPFQCYTYRYNVYTKRQTVYQYVNVCSVLGTDPDTVTVVSYIVRLKYFQYYTHTNTVRFVLIISQ